MHGFHHGGVPCECLKGGGLRGTSPVADLVRWRGSVGARAPRDGSLHVPPDPRHGVPLRAVGGPPPIADLRWPAPALGGRRAAVLQAQARHAVRAGLGQRHEEAWAPVRAPRGPVPTDARARGGRHRPVDLPPGEDVWEGPPGVDAPGRESTAAPRQPADPAVGLAPHPYRAALGGRDGARQARTARGRAGRDGLRLCWCDGKAAREVWPGRGCARGRRAWGPGPPPQASAGCPTNRRKVKTRPPSPRTWSG
jgi:hypothetical protein